MDIADFLELERSFESGGKVVIASEVEKIGRVDIFRRDFFYFVMTLERLLDEIREFLELTDDALSRFET